jgi:signal transduction histidine kinase
MAQRRHEVFDAALALVLLAVGLGDLFGHVFGGVFPGSRWVHLPLVVGMSAPIAFRRRWPLATLLAVAVLQSIWVFGLYSVDQQPPLEPFVALLIAVYSAAAYSDGRAARAAWLTVALGVLTDIPSLIAGKPLGNVAGPDVTLLIAFSLGLGFARNRRRARRHEQRAAEAEQAAAQAAERAAADERARIARELHDAISHDVSAIVLQAAAERQALASDTSQTERTLEAIESTGREALTELRRMLGALRQTGPDNPLSPQPGLAQVPELVSRANDAGIQVQLIIDGEPSKLPTGIELAAYRIAQEAITNVIKHAAGATAQIIVRYRNDAVEIDVHNSRPSSPGPQLAGSGHGLVGMRERVAFYRGTFTAGPDPDGGFRVSAVLPLGAA